MRIVIIGAAGFVGAALVRHFRQRGDDVLEVTRANYAREAGARGDVVIEAACNSRKFWAEENPFDEFDASVGHRLRSLRDFSADLHLHLSSVDVYDDLSSPAHTREEGSPIGGGSHYGFHKFLAEQLVRRHAARWLILRLAGMVGPGLRKNPVFDILHGNPLRIHPESKYQFISTGAIAAVTAQLIEAGVEQDVFNVCGAGLISPREIAMLAGRELDLSLVPEDARPRVVDVDISKISARYPMPATRSTIAAFLAERRLTGAEATSKSAS
jgi:nucleoside-diphosphate-sugar epimerase